MADIPSYLELPVGTRMPITGLGTWQAHNGDVIQAVDVALEAGYRLIDTAHSYRNEEAIGEALEKNFQSGKIKRENVFIITKAPFGLMETPELIRRALNQSLAALKLDYVDLYLLHFPVALSHTPDDNPQPAESPAVSYDHVVAWKVLEQLVDEGKVKAIGLSNFNSVQIDKIRAVARIPISNLQMECHLYLQQHELFQFCKERKITFTSYFSLGSPERAVVSADKSDLPGPLKEPLVLELSKKYNKTPAQILLRHLMQQGIAVIPKSVTPSRIKDNINVFDFTISNEDMALLLSGFPTEKRLLTMSHLQQIYQNPDYPFNIPF